MALVSVPVPMLCSWNAVTLNFGAGVEPRAEAKASRGPFPFSPMMNCLPFHKITPLFLILYFSNVCSIIHQTSAKVKCKSELLKCFSVQYIHNIAETYISNETGNKKSNEFYLHKAFLFSK